MKTMILFVCLAIAIAIPLIQGSCSTAPVKIRQTASGRNMTVCTLPNGMEILNGSVVALASCESCECNEQALSCCGIGHKAGVGPKPPKQCKIILDGCDAIMVKKADETKECVSGKSILVNGRSTYPYIAPNFGFSQQQYSTSNNMIPGQQPSWSDIVNWAQQQLNAKDLRSAIPYWLDTVNMPQKQFMAGNTQDRRILPVPAGNTQNSLIAPVNRKSDTASPIMIRKDDPLFNHQYIDRRFTQPSLYSYSANPYPFGNYIL